MKALVVDDSKLARLTLKKLLSARGVEVEQAESGEEALSQLESSRPDIVFMDNQMPNMNGIDAMRAIKGNPDTESIPVIMCTGQDEADFKTNAVNNGASGVLAKPPVVTELEDILEHAVQPKPAVVEDEGVGMLAASGEMDEFRNMLDSLAGQFQTLARKLEQLESGSPADRVNALEQRIAALESTGGAPDLGDLPERVSQLEGASPASTLEEFAQRLSRIESQQASADLGDLPERVAQLESNGPAQSPQIEEMLGQAIAEHGQTVDSRFSDLVSRLDSIESGSVSESSGGEVDTAAIVAEATAAALEQGRAEFEKRLDAFGESVRSELGDDVSVRIERAIGGVSLELGERDLERVREIAAEAAGSSDAVPAGEGGPDLNESLIAEARRAGEDAGRQAGESVVREITAGSGGTSEASPAPESLSGEVEALSRRQKALSGRIVWAYLFAAALGGAAIALPFLQNAG